MGECIVDLFAKMLCSLKFEALRGHMGPQAQRVKESQMSVYV